MLKKPKISKTKLKRHSRYVVEIDMCAAKNLHDIQCCDQIQSCHVRHNFFTMSRKPAKRELPMCAHHHLRQHSIGEPAFWGELMEDAVLLCVELWEISGDVEGGRWLVTNFQRNS
ncbi:hypothetical protein UFOVP353_29 [uncultured Caudovirales phage]|uniref:Uncharacterized protein n=1 Tax=uncultured Caudovirales phage TaxID=2100421 RepID=A0A6J5LYZ9_9CAUD|nr:hypothetical protein UFOVP353_29 [uncultured Caudovirales phage]